MSGMKISKYFIIFLILTIFTHNALAADSLQKLLSDYENACLKSEKSKMLEIFNKMQMKAFNITHDDKAKMMKDDEKIIVDLFAYHLPKGHKMKASNSDCAMVFHQLHESIKDGNKDFDKELIKEWYGCLDVLYKNKIPAHLLKIKECLR